MARLGPIILCAVVVCLGQGLNAADGIPPGFSQAAVHDPGSSHYIPLLPLGGVRTFSTFSGGNGFSSSGPYLPPSVYTSGAYPYFAMYQGPWMGMWGRPVQYGAFFPPVPLYGPAAVMPTRADGLGLGATKLVPPAGAKDKPQEVKDGFGELAAEKALKPKIVKARATNADSRARSQRFIVLGDGYFAKQAYADAYSRYKLAQQAAPDMADGFLRQGFALVAMGRYDNAARNLKRGISLLPTWAESDFRLDQLYVAGGLAKATHTEALAQETLKGPSSDLMFLLGVMLYFDGQAERAKPFFLRAKELAGGDDAHLDGFLRRFVPAAPEDEAPAPAEPVAVAKKPASPPANRIAPFSELPAPSAAAPRSPLPPATAPPRRQAPRAANGARDL